MREMMMTTDALVGIGMGQDVFVLTDGRFSGFTEGAAVGHMDELVVAVVAAEAHAVLLAVDLDAAQVDVDLHATGGGDGFCDRLTQVVLVESGVEEEDGHGAAFLLLVTLASPPL